MLAELKWTNNMLCKKAQAGPHIWSCSFWKTILGKQGLSPYATRSPPPPPRLNPIMTPDGLSCTGPLLLYLDTNANSRRNCTLQDTRLENTMHEFKSFLHSWTMKNKGPTPQNQYILPTNTATYQILHTKCSAAEQDRRYTMFLFQDPSPHYGHFKSSAYLNATGSLKPASQVWL